jgi:transcriptional regulator with XRE-family HTH domain
MIRKDTLVCLGVAIARTRTERRLTVTELGRRAGIHPFYLWCIERGLCDPGFATLCSIADVLEIGLGALVKRAERFRSISRAPELRLRCSSGAPERHDE